MAKQHKPSFEEFLVGKVADSYAKLGYSEVQDIKAHKAEYDKLYPEVKEVKAETKPEAKSEPKAQPKVETKSEPKPAK